MTNGNGYHDLARLENVEVRLYELTTRSHLRVGAGEGAADVAVENPIIRALVFESNGQEDRVPYIPASSLHGVVRAWVEKALRSGQEPLSRGEMEAHMADMDKPDRENLLDAARKEVAAFLNKEELTEKEDALLYQHWHVYRHPHICDPLSDVDKCERITQRESQARRWKVQWWDKIKCRPPCAVCHIFGYMGQRGRVKFTHAWPTTDQVPLDVITRVAINRLTGAADEGKLFDLEAIPPGVTFHFFTVLENMDDNGSKGHFEKGFRALNLQLAGLGAHSTVGFGMVDIKRLFTADIRPKVFDEDVDAKFITPMLEGENPHASTDVALKRLPRFFRALVIAHARNRPFGDLITFA